MNEKAPEYAVKSTQSPESISIAYCEQANRYATELESLLDQVDLLDAKDAGLELRRDLSEKVVAYESAMWNLSLLTPKASERIFGAIHNARCALARKSGNPEALRRTYNRG